MTEEFGKGVLSCFVSSGAATFSCGSCVMLCVHRARWFVFGIADQKCSRSNAHSGVL